MIDSKTTIVKKQVGLSKNGKVKERKSSSRTRPVVNRNRASSRTKPRNEARDGSPAVREQPEKGKKGRKKNRRTTVRAPLPTHYVKGMSKSREIDAQIDDEDDVVDLEEVEVDNERPSHDGLDPQEDENVDADVDADAKETEETHDKEIIEDNFDERGLEDEAACTANANTFQTALKSVDAAFYALGKFVGQNTCHTASLDSKVQLVEEEIQTSETAPTGNGEQMSANEQTTNLNAHRGVLYDDEGNYVPSNCVTSSYDPYMGVDGDSTSIVGLSSEDMKQVN